MTRPSTQRQDKRIIKLWEEGMEPKHIWPRLNLSSIYVVYEAIRRHRRITKIAQIPTRAFNK